MPTICFVLGRSSHCPGSEEAKETQVLLQPIHTRSGFAFAHFAK
jgi:hypothetical protein